MVHLWYTQHLCYSDEVPKCTQNTCPYLGLSHFEGLCATVDDWDIGTTRTDEAHALGVGSQLHSSLRGHSIAGVEDSAVWDSAEHGQVLQCHLRGAILTCTEQSTEPCNETCTVPANHHMKPSSKPSSQQNLK